MSSTKDEIDIKEDDIDIKDELEPLLNSSSGAAMKPDFKDEFSDEVEAKDDTDDQDTEGDEMNDVEEVGTEEEEMVEETEIVGDQVGGYTPHYIYTIHIYIYKIYTRYFIFLRKPLLRAVFFSYFCFPLTFHLLFLFLPFLAYFLSVFFTYSKKPPLHPPPKKNPTCDEYRPLGAGAGGGGRAGGRGGGRGPAHRPGGHHGGRQWRRYRDGNR